MKKLLIRFIDFYQKKISANTPPICRFTPTCSEYAKQALEVHGAFKGLLLSLLRFLRCNPLFKGGYDPVPKQHHWR